MKLQFKQCSMYHNIFTKFEQIFFPEKRVQDFFLKENRIKER